VGLFYRPFGLARSGKMCVVPGPHKSPDNAHLLFRFVPRRRRRSRLLAVLNSATLISQCPLRGVEDQMTAVTCQTGCLVKIQREPSYELKRVFLVSDLGIIQEVIDRR
jgi:hypothetical protein